MLLISMHGHLSFIRPDFYSDPIYFISSIFLDTFFVVGLRNDQSLFVGFEYILILTRLLSFNYRVFSRLMLLRR